MSEIAAWMQDKSKTETPQITEQENKLLEILRRIDYGEMRIVVKGSEVVQIEEKKSIKL